MSYFSQRIAAGRLAMIELKKFGRGQLGSLLPYISGQMRASAENAKRTQAEFIVAMRRYRSALEDTAYQAQLCGEDDRRTWAGARRDAL
jgi:hypothetical protein